MRSAFGLQFGAPSRQSELKPELRDVFDGMNTVEIGLVEDTNFERWVWNGLHHRHLRQRLYPEQSGRCGQHGGQGGFWQRMHPRQPAGDGVRAAQVAQGGTGRVAFAQAQQREAPHLVLDGSAQFRPGVAPGLSVQPACGLPDVSFHRVHPAPPMMPRTAPLKRSNRSRWAFSSWRPAGVRA